MKNFSACPVTVLSLEIPALYLSLKAVLWRFDGVCTSHNSGFSRLWLRKSSDS